MSSSATARTTEDALIVPFLCRVLTLCAQLIHLMVEEILIPSFSASSSFRSVSVPFDPLPRHRATGIAWVFTHHQDSLSSRPVTPRSADLAAQIAMLRNSSNWLAQLVGTGRTPVFASSSEEKILNSDVCALLMERSVNGRLDTCAPAGQLLTGATPSELGGVCQVAQKLEAPLLRLPNLFLGALWSPGLLLHN